MSEETNVAEELKELIDETISLKADKTDLDGLASVEAVEAKADRTDLEGIVKSEQLEEAKVESAEAIDAAKVEIREEMEAKFASVSPVAIKKEIRMYQFNEITKDNGEISNNLTLDIHSKSNNDAGGTETDIAGRSVDSASMYYTAEQFNPFAGSVATIPVSGGSVKLPELGGLSFSNEDEVPVNRPLASNSVSSKTIVIQNWTNYSQFSKPHVDDLPGLRSMVTSLILQKHSTKQAEETAAAIKASVVGSGFASVSTGVADGLPVSDDVIGKLADLMSAVDVAYRIGGGYHVSPAVYSAVLSSGRNANSGFAFDAASAQGTLFGYPITINSYLDDGATGGDVSAIFGDLGRGVAMCSRRALSIDEFPQAQPGFVTYYSDARWTAAVWDVSAVAGLETSA